ncbi:hypothetical protein ACM26V_09380 [Salipaludibacillus sp. HK11]|uniref:hypothetical protein n=1 Tax=Salipaludibacillus sp. HK11 TaxID=3394320 RepID=UPI0039FC22C1
MRHILTVLLGFMSLSLLIGCSNKDDSFDFLFFVDSFIHDQPEQQMRELVDENLIENSVEQISTTFFVPMEERLIIEIASHNGDILFLNREMTERAMDPEGLHAFDDHLSLETLANIPDQERKRHPDTNEWKVYAFPVSQTKIFKDNVSLQGGEEVFAIIPVYVEDPVASFNLIKELIGEEVEGK